MIIEFSLEFSPPCVYPEITKCYGGSIKRKNIDVTYIILSLSVVIVPVLSRHQKRTLKCCGGRSPVR